MNKIVFALAVFFLCACSALPAGDPASLIAAGNAMNTATARANQVEMGNARMTQSAVNAISQERQSAAQATQNAQAAQSVQATLSAGEALSALAIEQQKATLSAGKATMQVVQVTNDLIRLRAQQTLTAATPQPTEIAATQAAISVKVRNEQAGSVLRTFALVILLLFLAGLAIVGVIFVYSILTAWARIIEQRNKPIHTGDGVVIKEQHGWRFIPIYEIDNNQPPKQLQPAMTAISNVKEDAKKLVILSINKNGKNSNQIASDDAIGWGGSKWQPAVNCLKENGAVYTESGVGTFVSPGYRDLSDLYFRISRGEVL